ncbi:4Fe-4S single cluster domain-containing protein [Mycoplasmatota bacterium zrk1]
MIYYESYSIEENEMLYGPGKRLVLWVRGCSVKCPGCINETLWKRDFSKTLTIDFLLNLCDEESVDGVTLHGGEPLDQSEELFSLAKELRVMGRTVILFTGYLYKELSIKWQRLLWSVSDIVVAGKFVESKKNIYLQFRGSTNQRVYTHKGKYKDYKLRDGRTTAIISISDEGEMDIKGFYDYNIDQITK